MTVPRLCDFSRILCIVIWKNLSSGLILATLLVTSINSSSVAVMIPLSKANSIVKGFIVEPGSVLSEKTRFL